MQIYKHADHNVQIGTKECHITADCNDLAIQIQNSKTKNLHSLLSSSPTPKPFERRLCKFWFCCSGFHVARSLQSAVPIPLVLTVTNNCGCYVYSSPESNGYHDSEDSMDEMAQHVVVCGPYGTEPIPDISKARYDDNESLVYSRISLALSPLVGYPPSRNQVQSIPPKDTPRVRAEVYTPQRTR